MVTFIKITVLNQTKACEKISWMSRTLIQVDLFKQLIGKIGDIYWWDIKPMLSKAGFDGFMWLWELSYSRLYQ